jgi:hypothetical protein
MAPTKIVCSEAQTFNLNHFRSARTFAMSQLVSATTQKEVVILIGSMRSARPMGQSVERR